MLDLGKHEENMMISEPGDVEGMVGNIERLIKNKEKSQDICNKGLRTIGNLGWETSSHNLENVLRGGT